MQPPGGSMLADASSSADRSLPDVARDGGSDARTTQDVYVTDRCRRPFYGHVEPVATFVADAAPDADPVDASIDETSDARDVDARTTDRTDTSDGAADRVDGDGPDASLNTICWGLKSEFASFVQQNSACVTAADCILVVGSVSCDCTPNDRVGIGIGAGSAVAVTARDEAQRFIERWQSSGCEYWRGVCTADVLPSGTDCWQGKCQATLRSCINPPPTTPPAAEPCY
jgi:hypothetical protein